MTVSHIEPTVEAKIVIQTCSWTGGMWQDIVVYPDVPGAVREARALMNTPVRPGGRIDPNQRLTRQVTTIEVLE